uniref:Glycoside hydrolase family 2 catalytic domain-containing protein n=1 Tax=Cyanothece sp. (strain PCC 7425 / ATCC 29141) TaxID=395961 RepID=B8HXW1_CYAP4
MKFLGSSKKLYFSLAILLTSALALALRSQTPASALKGSNDLTRIRINGRQILLNGQPFVCRGVDYSPTPIGGDPNFPPNGDYFTNNYSSIWQRDLPRLREMGVNCLRIYGLSTTADHSAFLNAAWNGGNKPIYVLLSSYIEAGAVISKKATWMDNYRDLARNHKRFPAVLGYVVGNELNNERDRANPQFWKALDSIAQKVKIEDPDSVITTGLVDDGMRAIALGDKYMDNLNTWGVDIYRGKSFGSTFSEYKSASNKPLLILELGFPASQHPNNAPNVAVELPNNAQSVADYLENLWNEFLQNNAATNPNNVASGIFLFEWTDEWWKSGTPNVQNATAKPNAAFPGGWNDEEWYGINGISPGNPNVLQPRATFFRFKQLWSATTLRKRLTPVPSKRLTPAPRKRLSY